jgi:hypothetical protein
MDRELDSERLQRRFSMPLWERLSQYRFTVTSYLLEWGRDCAKVRED